MTQSGWSFLQLYYVTRVVFTGDSKKSPLADICQKVKDDIHEKLIDKWYKGQPEWDEVRNHYGSDKEFLKKWDEYLLPYREGRGKFKEF